MYMKLLSSVGFTILKNCALGKFTLDDLILYLMG
jgi:hypothetical protein